MSHIAQVGRRDFDINASVRPDVDTDLEILVAITGQRPV